MKVISDLFSIDLVVTALEYRTVLVSILDPRHKAFFLVLGWYLRPRCWEVNLRVYKSLGVPVCKRIVMGNMWILINLKPLLRLATARILRRKHVPRFRNTDPGPHSNYYMTPTESGAERYLVWGYLNELVHAAAHALVFPLILRSADLHDAYWWIDVVLAIGNLYLVLLQRYNRVRVLRFLSVLKKRRYGF